MNYYLGLCDRTDRGFKCIIALLGISHDILILCVTTVMLNMRTKQEIHEQLVVCAMQGLKFLVLIRDSAIQTKCNVWDHHRKVHRLD